MIGLIIILVCVIFWLCFSNMELENMVNDLEKENSILKTENYSLRRVLRENDMIPENFLDKQNKI